MTRLGFKAGPEGGGPGSGSAEGAAPGANASAKRSDKTPRERVREVAERSAAIIPLGLNGYFLYAFCYLIVWHRIRYENKKAAIAILVIFCWTNLHYLVSWVAIFAWGPGRITDRYVKNDDENAPFSCNEQGYSLYCTHCQRIKPNRAHHSKFTETCVPVMDHFCPWVGHVIGQGNMKFFFQLCCSSFAGMIIILVTLFVYQHQQVPHINGNSIAMYIVGGIVFLFTGMMAVSHAFYMMLSQSTLESLAARKGRIAHVNFLWRGDERRVIQPNKKDIRIPRPSQFSKGPWQNVLDVMGPVYTWTLPIRPAIHEPEYNPQFIEAMRRRIDEEDTEEALGSKEHTSMEHSV